METLTGVVTRAPKIGNGVVFLTINVNDQPTDLAVFERSLDAYAGLANAVIGQPVRVVGTWEQVNRRGRLTARLTVEHAAVDPMEGPMMSRDDALAIGDGGSVAGDFHAAGYEPSFEPERRHHATGMTLAETERMLATKLEQMAGQKLGPETTEHRNKATSMMVDIRNGRLRIDAEGHFVKATDRRMPRVLLRPGDAVVDENYEHPTRDIGEGYVVVRTWERT